MYFNHYSIIKFVNFESFYYAINYFIMEIVIFKFKDLNWHKAPFFSTLFSLFSSHLSTLSKKE